MEKSKFKYTTRIPVRHYEVDWQGIVHNSVYLLYFETGRIAYLKHIGLPVNTEAIRNESRIVIVRNEIDYKSPAKFGDVLTVHTRVAYIKGTSFGFEGIIENAATNQVVAENVAIHVWLDPQTGEPTPINEHFYEAVRLFEGDGLAIMHKI